MRFVQMSDIRFGEHTVPGGWLAKVPNVGPSVSDERIFVQKYVDEGMGRVAARTHARDVMQRVFEGGWIAGLRQAIRRWAEWYIEEFGDLRGFDPSRLSIWYVPFDNPGRAGKPGAIAEMRDMRSVV